jgi:hypothetical protein
MTNRRPAPTAELRNDGWKRGGRVLCKAPHGPFQQKAPVPFSEVPATGLVLAGCEEKIKNNPVKYLANLEE